MAVASSSSSSLPADVFLSFRGEDTRKSFVCHLYDALQRQAVNAYIDSEQLRKGDDLSDILEAITNSKLSVVVFSENYATSTWCLKELVQIVKSKEEQKQIVVPVFYGVDPSHVRKQEGSFAQAFAKHERDHNNDNDLLQKVKTWRSSLTEATNSSGWDSRTYKDDAELIKHIVDDVSEKLIRISPSKANDDLVGMDSHLHKMSLLLCPEIDDVRVVGIWGMGGIGKTTIARAVYDEIRQKFHHSCFLGNVREGFVKASGEHMKEKLRECLGTLDWLGNRKVLLVLDDIDKFNQIETLIGRKPSFGGGSRIIVTTRDSHVLNGFELKIVPYKPELLSHDEALGLFRRHAFGPNGPSREYDDLSSRAITYAHGLPLALKVLGGFLKNKSLFVWEDELEKLKENPNSEMHSEIQNVLRTNIDALDPYQKNIFLDIACFFKGMHEKYVGIILDRCGFHAHSGLRVLVDRALITLSKYGQLGMHDLLQEIGREIVHSESPRKPWKRTRLWSYQDVHDVSTQNKEMKVEGIMVKLPYSRELSDSGESSDSGELPNSRVIYLNAEAIVNMTNLRLFIITYPQYFGRPFNRDYDEESWFEPSYNAYQPNFCKLHLNGDLKFLSHKLRVLTWHACPLKSLPFNFDPKHLVHLDMSYSHIEQLWEGTKRIKELISIDLRGCKYLNKIPLCTEATKLEKLMLQGCTSLLEVHPSISALGNLVFLSFQECTELKILPSSIHHLKSLKYLNLYGCSNFEMFPEISEDMEALSELILDETAIKELPSSIERLRRLESLSMRDCKNLVRLPDSLCNLAGLRFLNLIWCSKLQNLPANFGSLESLMELELHCSGLEQLPVSILRLKLGRLVFHHCKQMVAPLSSWPSSIEDCCTVVVHLEFTDCNLLKLSDAIAHFSSLKILKLSRTNLERLPASMNRLVFLERLELEGCKRLKSIPELSSSISNINAHDCTALETVSTPKRPYDMDRCFTFTNCSKLVQNDLFRDIVETHVPPQGDYSRPFYMSFPRSEIPERFIYRCGGSSVIAQLPPNWFDNKFLGFAVCAVTNNIQDIYYEHIRLFAQCFCTFKGDHCKYRFSFYLFDREFYGRNWLQSNHMFLGYVPWSEYGMINRGEVNQRLYTEAKFEIVICSQYHNEEVDKCAIERCGVQFFFANNEEVARQDFGESSSSAITSDTSETDDEDEQYLKLSELFDGADRNSTESDSESDCEMEDNNSSGKRKILSRWTQLVRVTSGRMQGLLDDGFNGMHRDWHNHGTGYYRSRNYCNQPSCYAKSYLISSDDPTILEITYIGRHTCWKTQPMLTHQVRVKPGMGPEGPFDGFSWSKYGQKDFLGAKYPRVYYVCTPQNVRGCMSIKEVQCSNDDPTILKITYRGRHTCIQASTISIGGRGDGRISEGGGALRIHDQVVQSPRALGDNDSGGNVITLADRATDDNNANMLPNANSQDMTHSQNVNDMANNDSAGDGVASESSCDGGVNQLEEEDPIVRLNAFLVRLGTCCCSFLHG